MVMNLLINALSSSGCFFFFFMERDCSLSLELLVLGERRRLRLEDFDGDLERLGRVVDGLGSMDLLGLSRALVLCAAWHSIGLREVTLRVLRLVGDDSSILLSTFMVCRRGNKNNIFLLGNPASEVIGLFSGSIKIQNKFGLGISFISLVLIMLGYNFGRPFRYDC